MVTKSNIDTIGMFSIEPDNEMCKDCPNMDLELDTCTYEDFNLDIHKIYHLECKHLGACYDMYKKANKETLL